MRGLCAPSLVSGRGGPARAGAACRALCYVLELLPDVSYLSVVARPALHGKARSNLIAAALAGERLDPGQAVRVRVIEYEIPGRDGEGQRRADRPGHHHHTDPAAASALELARAYCQRWEEETSNDQVKTCLRGPGAAVQEPGHGSPGDLRQRAHPLRHLSPDLPGRYRSQHRP
jgi:hypothetical protein